MMHKLLADARFFLVLLTIDRDIARAVRAAGCTCEGAGTLHAAHYPRRPRGGPAALPEGYEKRFSFCCALEDCRSRTTPPSVRFMGRRWYLGPVVMLVSALQQGVTPERLAVVRDWLSSRGERLSRKTLERWREWWLEIFRESPTWKAGRDRFVPPVVEERLPQSLLERFRRDDGDDEQRLIAALRFVSPMTTGSCASSLTGTSRR
jgi:hypothetical protein